MKCLYWSLALLLFTSCAFHRGDLVSNIPNEPVEHVDMAIGVATTVKVFGMGSTNKDALVREAQQRMVVNRPLEGDEAYNNITTDFKTTWFLFVHKQKVTMTADVISPKEDESTPSYTKEYLTHMQFGQSIYDTLFQIGDTVIFNTDKIGEVIGYEGADGSRLRVQYSKKPGITKSKVVSGKSAFVLVKNYQGKRTVREERGVGPLIAFGVKSDMYSGTDGRNYKYATKED